MRVETKTPIDKLLEGGLENDAITNIYGPAGSGKTNIAMLAAISSDKKVVYIDTEGSFSTERFEQIGGNNKKMKNIILTDIHSWKEQHENVTKLEKIIEKEKIGLIIIDSLVALYRLELNNTNFQDINRQLATQYSILSRITRKHKIPVIVTNQVYSKGEQIEMTSRMIAKYWSKTIIELKKLDKPGHRSAIIKKHRSLPENKTLEFKITNKGIEETGRLGIF